MGKIPHTCEHDREIPAACLVLAGFLAAMALGAVVLLVGMMVVEGHGATEARSYPLNSAPLNGPRTRAHHDQGMVLVVGNHLNECPLNWPRTRAHHEWGMRHATRNLAGGTPAPLTPAPLSSAWPDGARLIASCPVPSCLMPSDFPTVGVHPPRGCHASAPPPPEALLG